MIFPTWDKYHETIDALDQMTEQYCDNFDSSVPNGISDEQYDALADAANFDEDDILRKFEEDLEFCSLRQKIEALENSWLEQQGDGDWDMDSDPDNHFIDDETERALLSQNVEVIIGDKIKGYTYYRFFHDMGTWIELYANNISVLTQMIQNQPVKNPISLAIVHKPEILYEGSCKYKVDERKPRDFDNYKLKRVSKVRPAFGTNCLSNPCKSIFPSIIKSKTKGYVKRGNKWRSRRLNIAAGICGENPNEVGYVFIDCVDEDSLYKVKEKRRRKVKVKYRSITDMNTYYSPPRRYNFELRDNRLYSFHKVNGNVEKIDFYDYAN